MDTLDPVVTVLVFSSLAAAMAGIGALVPIHAGGRGDARIGLAYAIAGGLMIGTAHLLVAEQLRARPVLVLVGCVVGVAYTWGARRFAPTATRDGTDETSLALGYRVLLQTVLHGSAEGIAIGVAMVVNLRLGIFMALVLAVHNIAEAWVMTSVLRPLRLPTGNAVALAVFGNVGQPLFALVVWALSPLIGGLLPAALGFSAGAMTYLVLTELLPDSYRRAGRLTIALAVTMAAATVVLLEAVLLGEVGS